MGTGRGKSWHRGTVISQLLPGAGQNEHLRSGENGELTGENKSYMEKEEDPRRSDRFLAGQSRGSVGRGGGDRTPRGSAPSGNENEAGGRRKLRISKNNSCSKRREDRAAGRGSWASNRLSKKTGRRSEALPMCEATSLGDIVEKIGLNPASLILREGEKGGWS